MRVHEHSMQIVYEYCKSEHLGVKFCEWLCVLSLLEWCKASSVHVLSAILAMTSGKNEVTLAMISLQ